MSSITASPAGDAAHDGAAESAVPLVAKNLVKLHLIASILWMISSMTWGFLASLQFLHAYPAEGIEWFSFGRIRLLHTNEIAYGCLVNGFIGCLYYVVPRLTGRKVLSAGLGLLVFWVWQFLTVATSVGQLLGKTQALEWGETPTGFKPGTFELNYIPVDFLIEVGAVLVALQFMTPIVKAMKERMYVSLWYISAGIVWLILTYVMGNTLVEWNFPGSSGAAASGLYIHDLVGLFVTPMGWGMMYFFVPIILRKPIWSHALSVIGFWSLAFFYPLNGVHHYLLSSIPMSVQYGAVISTMAVEIVVTTVIVNFFGTMWGRGRAIHSNLTIRWFYTGMILYFITCLQCAVHTTLSVQKVIHFTDWVPGHAHLVMLGVFSFWIIGMTQWLWPRMTGNEWYSRRLNHWQYWLTLIGLFTMFVDLLAAGVIHGYMLDALSPWMDIVRAMYPFWLLRTIAGGMILAGQILFFWNLWKTARTPKPYDHRWDLVDAGGAA
ncbi:MAG: Cytochrome c oxidase subunit 1, bacteroid [Planctomycetes bacterium]|nr:Cytochrome c oxidase subunit 1, bacteroid [Planctomycetota bacterium]